MNEPNELSRRSMMKIGAAALAALPLGRGSDATIFAAAQRTTARDEWRGLKIGVASYTLRKMPTDAAIKAIQRVGLKYVSIKDAHLPTKTTAAERRAGAQAFKDAGITPLSCGNFNMNTEAETRPVFEYARDAGLPVIVCTPDPKLMPVLDKLVKEFDIKLALHNHGPKAVYPSPYDAMRAAEPFDRRIGLCIDVGHTLRAGVDPAESILKCRARLYDIHLKDLASSAEDAATLEVGRGVMDFRSIFRALMRIDYGYMANFEYEKDADDPVPGLAESVGYARGLMSQMKA